MPTARSRSSFRRSARWRRPCAGSAPATAGAASTGRWRSSARGRPGGLHRLRAGPARLRRQERLQGRGARPLRRHRFRAVRGDGGRCARRRARALRDAAVPLHLAGIARRRGAGRARRSASSYDMVPIESAVQGLEKRAGAAVRRPAARRHRGESAGARARHHPDGDLQQVRPDGGDDRQQVGNVGRLRHALRRHERRLQSGQGPLQDRGLSAVAPAQRLEARRRAGRRRPGDPGEHHHPRADRGAAREPEGPGFAAALRHARRDPRAAGRARGADRRRSSPRASTARR